MKKVASVMVVMLIFGSAVFAIPNNIGGGFMNLAGMRFEDFAVLKASWKQDGKLLGKWEMWNDERTSAAGSENTEVLKLSIPAVVFGLKAELVTVYRKNETVQMFRVDFADDERIGKSLRTNLGLWADGKWDASGKVITHKGNQISVQEGNVVEFVVL